MTSPRVLRKRLHKFATAALGVVQGVHWAGWGAFLGVLHQVLMIIASRPIGSTRQIQTNVL